MHTVIAAFYMCCINGLRFWVEMFWKSNCNSHLISDMSIIVVNGSAKHKGINKSRVL